MSRFYRYDLDKNSAKLSDHVSIRHLPLYVINPLQPNISMHILHTVLYTFPKVLDKENLSNKQELLQLVIISFILMTFMCDLGVKLQGEIRCELFLGVKGLIVLTLQLPDQICNSPYCHPYNSHNGRSENLELDQLIIPNLIYFLILITCLVNTVMIL